MLLLLLLLLLLLNVFSEVTIDDTVCLFMRAFIFDTMPSALEIFSAAPNAEQVKEGGVGSSLKTVGSSLKTGGLVGDDGVGGASLLSNAVEPDRACAGPSSLEIVALVFS
jgi:hypothetical protein